MTPQATQSFDERVVIIDFDNLDRPLKHRGIFKVVWRILEQIVDPTVLRQPRYILRLYGGWYQGHKLTRQAQDLTIGIGMDVPRLFPLLMNGTKCRVPVTVELAYSLAAIPAKHLLATYRPRSVQTTIQCRDPRGLGCKAPSCPMGAVYAFFQNSGCPDNQCPVSTQDLLFRGEQKLVDTMMLSDLIYYANAGYQILTIVSSDDDLWPGILSALHYGAEVRHVRTRPIPPDHYGYTANLPGIYKATSLS